MSKMWIEFAGTMVEAKQVTWAELNKINDEADDFLLYLGNYFSDKYDKVYALFTDSYRSARYSVELPK